MVAHTPGAEATETEPQVCTDCGYIIAPVKKHVHQLIKTAEQNATCSEAGNKEYYSCSGCSDLFSDAEGKNIIEKKDTVIPSKGHTASAIESNGELHWKTCTDCGIVLAETKLPCEDADKNGKCDSCGSKIQMQPTETTLPATDVSTEESTAPITTELPETSENNVLPPETTVPATETLFEPTGTAVTSTPTSTDAAASESSDIANSETQNSTENNSTDNTSRLEKKTLITLAIVVPSAVLVLGGGGAMAWIFIKKKK